MKHESKKYSQLLNSKKGFLVLKYIIKTNSAYTSQIGKELKMSAQSVNNLIKIYRDIEILVRSKRTKAQFYILNDRAIIDLWRDYKNIKTKLSSKEEIMIAKYFSTFILNANGTFKDMFDDLPYALIALNKIELANKIITNDMNEREGAKIARRFSGIIKK